MQTVEREGVHSRVLPAENGAERAKDYDKTTAWVEVNLARLVENLCTLRSVARGTQVLAVVKANAYGLGVREIGRTLESHGVWGFAVASLSEGVELREAGIGKPILVLRPAELGDLRLYCHYGLRPVLESIGEGENVELPFHIEIDTGMARTGVRWDDRSTLQRLASAKPEGAFTHFHSADACSDSLQVQWKRFERALQCMNYRPRLLHAANSAASWRLSAWLDLIRPGIFLYGGSPGPNLPAPKPVVSLRARVISLRSIRKGESVSYGAEWRADADSRVATLPVGYADGIPRNLDNSAYVLIDGRRCPIIGRITMDMTMVDVGPGGRGRVSLGDTATFIGVDNDSVITLEQFAVWSKTICYEVFTRIGSRLPRIYTMG